MATVDVDALLCLPTHSVDLDVLDLCLKSHDTDAEALEVLPRQLMKR